MLKLLKLISCLQTGILQLFLILATLMKFISLIQERELRGAEILSLNKQFFIKKY